MQNTRKNAVLMSLFSLFGSWVAILPPHCSRQSPEPIAMLLTMETITTNACSPSGMLVECNAVRGVCEF